MPLIVLVSAVCFIGFFQFGLEFIYLIKKQAKLREQINVILLPYFLFSI